MTRPCLVAIELHHLGDLVMAVPFLSAAKTSHEVHLVCRPSVVPLARRLLPDILVHPWDPPWHRDSPEGSPLRSIASFLKMARCLAALVPDVAVCAWADPRAHWLMRLSRARKRIGFPVTRANFYAHDFAGRRKTFQRGIDCEWIDHCPLPVLGKSTLTHPLHRPAWNAPHTANWALIADATGLELARDLSESIPSPRALPPGLASWFQDRKEAGRRVLVVHPGGRLGSKRWGAARFDWLLAQLASTSHRVASLVIESTEEPALRPAPATGTLWRPRSLGELTDILAHADAVLCNDSLAGHLATVLGKPVRAVFTTGNPDWFAPGGNPSNAIFRLPQGAIPQADADGQPCYVDPSGPAESDVLENILALLHNLPAESS